ncbi:MAG TPA: MEKHLA domain-containing protein [Rhizomicrobium sp.]
MIDHAGYRLKLIAESFQRLVARPLVMGQDDVAQSLWRAPFVIVAHGTEPDPIFFFGNKLALDLFETSPAAFAAMPSRLSAEQELRQERAKLMARVTRDGYIDDYSGIRISATGRRFRIQNAIVWNLVDKDGRLHGQAATFSDWTPIG